MPASIVLVLILAVIIFNTVKVIPEFQRAVVFRFGRLKDARGPGLIFLIPGVERMQRVDLRTITMDVPAQDVITRDNVSVKVNAVVYFRVIDVNKAIVEVENFLYFQNQTTKEVLLQKQKEGLQRRQLLLQSHQYILQFWQAYQLSRLFCEHLYC